MGIAGNVDRGGERVIAKSRRDLSGFQFQLFYHSWDGMRGVGWRNTQ